MQHTLIMKELRTYGVFGRGPYKNEKRWPALLYSYSTKSNPVNSNLRNYCFSLPSLQQRPDIARLMQLHAQAQANLTPGSGPPGLPPGLPPGALALPPGLPGVPPGIPTSLSTSLLSSLPTSIAASLSGLGPSPLHPALSMLKPQLPLEPKREEEVRKSLSESNGKLRRKE